MKKTRRSKAAKNKLLPTNARHCFYDPQQLQSQQPRRGGLRFNVGGTIVLIAWAGATTTELQNTIDELTKEVPRRAFAGENEAIETFALRVSNLARWLQDITQRQREKAEQVAARAPLWPVNVTQRDTDFTWAKKYVRSLKVGSKSLLRANVRSRIARHEHFAGLAERLWLQLLKNQDDLLRAFEKVGNEKARKFKTEWISLCVSLPAVRTWHEVSPQDAPKWWWLGEALLLEAWEQDRQSAFGSVLPQYAGKDQTGKDKYSEAETKRDIFKRFRSAFLRLVKSGMTSTE